MVEAGRYPGRIDGCAGAASFRRKALARELPQGLVTELPQEPSNRGFRRKPSNRASAGKPVAELPQEPEIAELPQGPSSRASAGA